MKFLLVVIACVAVHCVLGITKPTDVDAKVKLIFFYGPDFDTDRTIINLNNANSLLTNPNFKPAKTTAFFIHGYDSSGLSDTVRTVTNAYFTNNNYNIVAIDWETLSTGLYNVAVLNLIHIADRMVDVFLALIAAGLSPSKVHLVGHSLGGHMAGMIGNGIQVKSGNTLVLDRITGLDPAGPSFLELFHVVPIFARQLAADDAVFVDVIHTDAGFMGDANNMGNVDFWPNSGTQFQPGCPAASNAVCSHSRAWQFWAVSLILAADSTAFTSVQSKGWASFVLGNNIGTRTISMGINCPRDVSGNWFLETSGEPLYSLGANGIHFEPNKPRRPLRIAANVVSRWIERFVHFFL